ncbi:MAG: diacylglycerol/lipid kinase family protein, partial [Acidobacteriota bacterium]
MTALQAQNDLLANRKPYSFFERKRTVAVINARAGSVEGESPKAFADGLIELLRGFGADARVRMSEPWNLSATLRNAVSSGADIVMVGGGDGTINAAAQHLHGTSTVLAVLPMGTLNHFSQV